MSQTIKIANFASKNLLETTFLGADLAANSTAAIVENTDGIAVNSHLVIGRPGEEQSEKVDVTIDPTDHLNIEITSTLYAHLAQEPVTVIFGDQISLYRATNVNGEVPADDQFSVISTFDVDFDQPSTSYTDTSGGEGYWYKSTFRDSVSNNETPLNSSAAVRGGGYGDYCSIESIKQEAGFQNNPRVTDTMVDQKRQAAQDEINAKLKTRYSVPFARPVNAYISDITVRLAAGLLLLSLYGEYGTDDNNPGKSKVAQARADIKELQEGGGSLVDDGGEDSIPGSTGFIGWPNSDTAATPGELGGGERLFRISERY
jgi:hypothetical protein